MDRSGATTWRKFLVDQKAFEARKQGLTDDLLRQKAEAVTFDYKLARLGYRSSDGTRKKSHYKGPGQKPPDEGSAESPVKPKGKT